MNVELKEKLLSLTIDLETEWLMVEFNNIDTLEEEQIRWWVRHDFGVICFVTMKQFKNMCTRHVHIYWLDSPKRVWTGILMRTQNGIELLKSWIWIKYSGKGS